eukprot:128702-Prymnesium_polylepis.2
MKKGSPQPNTRAKLLDKEKRVLFMSKTRRYPNLCSTGTLRFYVSPSHSIANLLEPTWSASRQPSTVNRNHRPSSYSYGQPHLRTGSAPCRGAT